MATSSARWTVRWSPLGSGTHHQREACSGHEATEVSAALISLSVSLSVSLSRVSNTYHYNYDNEARLSGQVERTLPCWCRPLAPTTARTCCRRLVSLSLSLLCVCVRACARVCESERESVCVWVCVSGACVCVSLTLCVRARVCLCGSSRPPVAATEEEEELLAYLARATAA